VALYRQFFHALKPGGTLITSFLTPPPGAAAESEWTGGEVNAEDALLQKIVFVDILEAAWQSYRSSALTTQQLVEAGFTNIQIIPDRANIFPTVTASRPV